MKDLHKIFSYAYSFKELDGMEALDKDIRKHILHFIDCVKVK